MPRLIRSALEKAELVGVVRVATGVDVVGDLAVVRLSGLGARAKKRFASALMEETRNVKGVFEQEGGIEGELRLRKLKHLAGEKRTLTLHKENGCVFKVDIARCYFSPRLSTERLRIARETRKSEAVINMFAGVGPFSIEIAKLAGAQVTSCEVNPYAVKLHLENNRLNKVDPSVQVIEGDARDLPRLVGKRFDRILMPHPSMSLDYLPTALALAKRRGRITYYRHVLGRYEAEASEAVSKELEGAIPPSSKWTTRRVREVGPRWVEMAADIRLP